MKFRHIQLKKECLKIFKKSSAFDSFQKSYNLISQLDQKQKYKIAFATALGPLTMEVDVYGIINCLSIRGVSFDKIQYIDNSSGIRLYANSEEGIINEHN